MSKEFENKVYKLMVDISTLCKKFNKKHKDISVKSCSMCEAGQDFMINVWGVSEDYKYEQQN